MTTLIHSKHPLLPAADTKHLEVVIQEGETLAELFARSSIIQGDPNHPISVQVNGQPILNGTYDQVVLQQDDMVTVRAAVAGGGGSNPLQIILMIVIIVASIYLGPEVGAAFGATGSTAAALGGAIITIAGTLILNSIFGPTIPKVSGGSGSSPTYSISGTNNQARLGQPLPIAMGYNKIVPDVGASPFVEFKGSDQYLYQVFNFGLPKFDLTELKNNLKIGNTLLTNYADVEVEFSGADGKLTLFPGNVFTDSSQLELTKIEGPVTRTTSIIGCTKIGVDIGGQLFHANDDGSIGSMSVTLVIEYRITGTSGAWTPFVKTPTNYANRNYGGYGGHVPSGEFSGYDGYSTVVQLTNDTSTPITRTYTADVPLGQYDVRITRTSADYDPAKDTHDVASISWIGLRSYQPDSSDYTGQQRMAIKVKASGQLNGAISQLSSVAHTQCPVWTGTSWVTQSTSNPAWWFLWFARGAKYTSGQRRFGVGYDDSQIDIATIIEWGAWCDANNLKYNFVLDQQVNCVDALNMMARCGRGMVTLQKGTLGVIYDLEGQAPVQMFGMSNIKAGSFQVAYASTQLAEQIIVQFINPELDWVQDQVYVNIPGVVSPEYSNTQFIPGITSKAQAAQEANLQAAAQLYFRRRVTFETDGEGLMCSRGDVIKLTHDLTAWSDSGRLVSGTTTQVVLDRQVTGTASTQPYFSIRYPDGSIETVEVVPFVGPSNTLALVSALTHSANADTNNLPQDYIWQFNPQATPGRLMKVTNVEHTGSNGQAVKITCREETANYYNAINGAFNYTSPSLLNQITPTVSNIKVTESTIPGTPGTTVNITWTNTNSAGARLRVQQGAGALVDYGRINSNVFTFAVLKPTVLIIELTPIALAQVAATTQTPVQVSYTMKGVTALPENVSALVPDVTGLSLFDAPNVNTFAGNDAKFTWRLSAASAPEIGSEPQGGDSGVLNPYFKDYEVQIANTDGTVRRTEYTTDTSYTYTFEKNYEDGNGTPVRSFLINVVARGQQNQLSEVTAKLAVSNPVPLVPTGIDFTGMLNSIALSFDAPSDPDYAGCLIYGTTNATTLPGGTFPIHLDTKLNNHVLIPNLVSGSTYYFYISPYDGFGKSGSNVSSQYTCATVLIATIDIGPGSITATQLANAAVTTAKIVPGAVDSTILAAGAVNNAALAAAAVATTNIQSAAITTALIAANAVDAGKLASSAVTTAKIASGAVTTAALATAAVTTAILATGAVTSTNIAANTITAANILAGTITTTEIASATIVAGDIASGTITGSLIAAATITASNITSATITGSLIAATTITAANILAGTITTTEIAANTIVAGDIAAATITGSLIAAGTITASNILSSTITASQIAASTITTTQIAALTILAGDIAAATITGAKIAANTITSGNIAANTITASNIAANTITGAKIAANTITATELAVLSGGGTSIDMSNGLIVINNGTTMTIQGDGFGASNQFMEWTGPTQSSASNYAACTTANATSYLTTSGAAYFAGGVNITTSGLSGLNGYLKHPPNAAGTQIIEQWGYYTQSSSSPDTVSFNIAFPTKCVNVTIANSTGTQDWWVGTLTASGFQWNFGAGGYSIFWRAIGY